MKSAIPLGRTLVLLAIFAAGLGGGSSTLGLEAVQYNHPGLVVDLAVGLWAWPLPIDWDGDKDLDLIVSCPDVPSNGIYFFENPGGEGKMPVFRPPVRLGPALGNVQVSYVDGQPRVLTPGTEHIDFLGLEFGKTRRIQLGKVKWGSGRIRGNQWKYVDYDGDGVLDLTVGIGDWGDYGWDNAFNERGEWTRGPLHGYVYLVHNAGSSEQPDFEKPVQITARGKPIDVFGMPSPNFADFDGDGDLDLICGEFLDGFTYFENTSSRTHPEYAAGRRLTHDGKPLAMDLQMITPTAVDWDHDGNVDLVVGDEDGRVALVEHSGRISAGTPQFLPPVYFRQQARDLKFGALVTPVSTDFDGDGDEDLVCGNTAGYVGYFENLDGGNPPRWAAPRRLNAGGKTLRIEAGPNGSIQGPCEAKWGYTTLSVADWDADQLPDLIVNSIWGKVVWYRNVGTPGKPEFAAAAPVEVQWPGQPPKPAWNWWDPAAKELATQWRTTPVAVDWTGNGLTDLVMLDHQGYLALFRRERCEGRLVLLPGERVFHDVKGQPLRLNSRSAGGSGRRKLCLVDFDGDGRRDLLANSRNADFFQNVSADGPPWALRNLGSLGERRLAGHTTSPTTVDWDGDGRRDLLVGAEDGHLYHLPYGQTSIGPKHFQMGGFTVEGRRFEIARLENGAKAFGNRGYTWCDLPDALQGWHYTRTCGGEAAAISVSTADPATVYLATATSQPGIDLAGWTQAEGLVLGYTDKGRTRMQVFRRELRPGQKLVLPQGNWSGGLLLVRASSEPK